MTDAIEPSEEFPILYALLTAAGLETGKQKAFTASYASSLLNNRRQQSPSSTDDAPVEPDSSTADESAFPLLLLRLTRPPDTQLPGDIMGRRRPEPVYGYGNSIKSHLDSTTDEDSDLLPSSTTEDDYSSDAESPKKRIKMSQTFRESSEELEMPHLEPQITTSSSIPEIPVVNSPSSERSVSRSPPTLVPIQEIPVPVPVRNGAKAFRKKILAKSKFAKQIIKPNHTLQNKSPKSKPNFSSFYKSPKSMSMPVNNGSPKSMPVNNGSPKSMLVNRSPKSMPVNVSRSHKSMPVNNRSPKSMPIYNRSPKSMPFNNRSPKSLPVNHNFRSTLPLKKRPLTTYPPASAFIRKQQSNPGMKLIGMNHRTPPKASDLRRSQSPSYSYQQNPPNTPYKAPKPLAELLEQRSSDSDKEVALEELDVEKKGYLLLPLDIEVVGEEPKPNNYSEYFLNTTSPKQRSVQYKSPSSQSLNHRKTPSSINAKIRPRSSDERNNME